jgi:hypothetical protein
MVKISRSKEFLIAQRKKKKKNVLWPKFVAHSWRNHGWYRSSTRDLLCCETSAVASPSPDPSLHGLSECFNEKVHIIAGRESTACAPFFDIAVCLMLDSDIFAPNTLLRVWLGRVVLDLPGVIADSQLWNTGYICQLYHTACLFEDKSWKSTLTLTIIQASYLYANSELDRVIRPATE